MMKSHLLLAVAAWGIATSLTTLIPSDVDLSPPFHSCFYAKWKAKVSELSNSPNPREMLNEERYYCGNADDFEIQRRILLDGPDDPDPELEAIILFLRDEALESSDD
jgi:hypothetical protein